MHDDDRAWPRPSTASRDDQRRWGGDPSEDRHARGVAQDVRQFGDDRGRADEPPIDAEREPGRAQHLATGEGGTGDWTASAFGSGQRRGPVDPDRPFGVRDDDRQAPGHSYGGWAQAGSMQGRWRGDAPRADDLHRVPAAAPARRPGPRGWQRSDARIHDDVCERLARSGLDAADVSVEVRAGHVTLAGTVADRPTKHAIESLVDASHGVHDIDNRIKVMRGEPPRDGPPQPRPWVPQDSPTARDEARGRVTRLPRDASGYYG